MDAIGATVWAVLLAYVDFLFSGELTYVATRFAQLGGLAAAIVLYCSCPNEASSARVALKLKRRGIDRVFPMTGGMEAWLSEGFSIDTENSVL